MFSCPQTSQSLGALCHFFSRPKNYYYDSLYDQGPWHVKNLNNIVMFIDDYKKSKEIPKDKWAWHMHPVVVDKQLNLDNCGVCTCFEI
jgi:hypothetical protein